MVKNHKTTVPIVQQDRGQEETILQIAYALDCLEKVATNIFCHVESKIEKSKQHLASLQRRCLTVQSKIDRITGISKSITVYCSSKYPGTSRDRSYKYELKSVDLPEPQIKVKHRPLPSEKLSLKEKLKFYHVKDKEQQLRKNNELFPCEGLGSLPEDVRNVSSLLLFNTNENLFNEYKIVDPLSNAFKQISVEDKGLETPEIEPAPISVRFNEESNYRVDRNFFYSPSLQNVPQMEAPLDLPDLPGIAGDLRYTLDHAITETVTEPDQVPIDCKDEEISTIIEELPKLECGDPLPSPPQPPPPPPPPPPLPPIAPPPPVPPTEHVSVPSTSSHPPPTDLRANLMEAIRNAGGSGKANLKSVSKLDQEGPTENKSKGNLMDDLHAKLSMRRKGISGKIDNPEGLIEKIASMIPPPPSKEQEVEVEDEWED